MLKSTGKRKAPKESSFRPRDTQPVKKRKKTKLSIERKNILFHSQNKSPISENRPLSEKVSEMEQLLQEMKAVQGNMKFERDSFEKKLKLK